MGRGSDSQVVSVPAFYSDDPSLNPAKSYCFLKKLWLKINKINEKSARLAHL